MTTEADKKLVRMHIDWLRRTGATVTTQRYRSGVLRRLAATLPDDTRLIDATPEQLDDWQSGLDVGISTIAGYTSHVHRFYGWGVDHGHLDIDPSLKLPVPKVSRRPPRPIPTDDLDVAMRCAQGQAGPMHVWLVLGAYMGFRSMEIAGMRRENITTQDGRLYIDGTGKGNKPFRMVIPLDVEPVLRPWLVGSPGPLFRTGPGGHPTRACDVSKQIRTFFASIGMPYSAHRLRHTFGTRLYAQTRDLLIVKDLMRHESANTTQGYVQTLSGEAVSAADRLSRNLRPRRRAS